MAIDGFTDTLVPGLADVDNLLDGSMPWRMFEVLRRTDPVHWNAEHDGGSGFWSLTKHADIIRADRDSARLARHWPRTGLIAPAVARLQTPPAP